MRTAQKKDVRESSCVKTAEYKLEKFICSCEPLVKLLFLSKQLQPVVQALSVLLDTQELDCEFHN